MQVLDGRDLLIEDLVWAHDHPAVVQAEEIIARARVHVEAWHRDRQAVDELAGRRLGATPWIGGPR